MKDEGAEANTPVLPAATGKGVLIVEDEPLLGAALDAALRRAGCRIVGPAGTLTAALMLAREARYDAALLDINLRGELSYPVAELLVARAIPFAFLTGYTLTMLPAAFQKYLLIQKPVLAGTIPGICATLWSAPLKNGNGLQDPAFPASPTS